MRRQGQPFPQNLETKPTINSVSQQKAGHDDCLGTGALQQRKWGLSLYRTKPFMNAAESVWPVLEQFGPGIAEKVRHEHRHSRASGNDPEGYRLHECAAARH